MRGGSVVSVLSLIARGCKGFLACRVSRGVAILLLQNALPGDPDEHEIKNSPKAPAKSPGVDLLAFRGSNHIIIVVIGPPGQVGVLPEKPEAPAAPFPSLRPETFLGSILLGGHQMKVAPPDPPMLQKHQSGQSPVSQVPPRVASGTAQPSRQESAPHQSGPNSRSQHWVTRNLH